MAEPVLLRVVWRSSVGGAHNRCFAAVAAVGFILLIAPECPAASKITSWEVGKVLDADRKQELVGTAEHSSTYGPASHSTTSALYNALVVECEAGPYVELCSAVPTSSCFRSASNTLPTSHDVIFEAAGHSGAMSRMNPTAATAAKHLLWAPPTEDRHTTRNRTGSAIPFKSLPYNLYAILFNHRVRQHLMRDRFHIFLRLLPGHTVRDGDVEELALAHVGDGGVPQSRQRGADGLALRIEHGGFQRDIYASFHETSIIRGLYAEALDGVPVHVDAQPRLLRNFQVPVLGAQLLPRARLAQVGFLFGHELADQRVGDGVEPVQRCRHVDVGRESVVGDRQAAVPRQRGNLHRFGEAAAAGQIHLHHA